MTPGEKNVLKSLVAVAWADGKLEGGETGVIEGLLCGFDASEQAALAVAELMPFGHHQIGDDDVARLQSAFGARGAVALLTAIAFFDVVCRLKLVLEVGVESHALERPPLLGGNLV